MHRPRSRIESLSDLIFGLALSIGAVSLISSTSLASPPSWNSIENSLLIFGFSFLILINVWTRYTGIMAVLPLETRSAFNLNLLLLFFVSIEPYFFNLLSVGMSFGGQSGGSQYAPLYSSLYGVDIGAINLILGGFAMIVTRRDSKLASKEEINDFKRLRNRQLAVGLIFAVSSAPIFWFTVPFTNGLTLRYLLWLATIPITWIARLVRK